jgi:hypothetical protein
VRSGVWPSALVAISAVIISCWSSEVEVRHSDVLLCRLHRRLSRAPITAAEALANTPRRSGNCKRHSDAQITAVVLRRPQGRSRPRV